MPIAPNINVAQAQMRYTQDSQLLENILYFVFPSPVTVTDCEGIGNDLAGWWSAFLDPLQSDTVTLREVYVKQMISSGGPEFTSTFGLPHAGSNASPPLPNNATCAISFRTGLTGRAHRGRNYLIGLCENQVDGNTLIGTPLTAYQTAYEALLPGGGVILSGDWCVYSQWFAGNVRIAGIATPVSSVLFADATMDSQRRRLPGRGQ